MSDGSPNNNLEDRLSRLERKVDRLERIIRQEKESVDKAQRQESKTPVQEQAGQQEVRYEETKHPEKSSSWEEHSNLLGQNWLNWLGIGLLLLGVMFLFKYSIDQGWLIPPVRSAFGVAIGCGLLAGGFAVEKENILHQILLGGGIAAFYITGFASFQLYTFLSNQLVWIFMVAVTIFALLLSLREDEPILSVVGTIGGLGTPFMLYTGQGSLPMLMLYTAVVLIGPVILYMIKGWKSLLWSAVVGGWLVLMVGLVVNVLDVENPSSLDRWTLQLGALFMGMISWIIPVYREILTHRNPQRWPDPADLRKEDSARPFIANVNVQALSVLMPVSMLFYSYGLWSISSEVWGVIALIASLFIGYSYLPLRSEGLFKLSLVHGFTALIMITISLALLLDGEILLIALTLEALCLRIIASKTGDRNISLSSHILFGFIAIWMVDRLLIVTPASMPLFNLDAITELFIIGIGGIMVPSYIGAKKMNITTIYRLTAHVALLGWFLKEFTTLQNGQAYVSVAWGIYALVVLYVGFRESNIRIRLLGMATIFLVVGKLFLIDLTQINTLLRILLFIGFGAIFLLVSYFLHKNWGDSPNSAEPAKEAEID